MGVVENPLAAARDFFVFPLAGGDGVEAEMDEHAEACVAPPLHPGVAVDVGLAQFAELMAVVGMANETNRLVAGYQVEVDKQFKMPFSK